MVQPTDETAVTCSQQSNLLQWLWDQPMMGQPHPQYCPICQWLLHHLIVLAWLSHLPWTHPIHIVLNRHLLNVLPVVGLSDYQHDSERTMLCTELSLYSDQALNQVCYWLYWFYWPLHLLITRPCCSSLWTSFSKAVCTFSGDSNQKQKFLVIVIVFR